MKNEKRKVDFAAEPIKDFPSQIRDSSDETVDEFPPWQAPKAIQAGSQPQKKVGVNLCHDDRLQARVANLSPDEEAPVPDLLAYLSDGGTSPPATVSAPPPSQKQYKSKMKRTNSKRKVA